MIFLTEWEGQIGKYLASNVSTEHREVMLCKMAEIFFCLVKPHSVSYYSITNTTFIEFDMLENTTFMEFDYVTGKCLVKWSELLVLNEFLMCARP